VLQANGFFDCRAEPDSCGRSRTAEVFAAWIARIFAEQIFVEGLGYIDRLNESGYIYDPKLKPEKQSRQLRIRSMAVGVI
jgi:hypothetical protein